MKTTQSKAVNIRFFTAILTLFLMLAVIGNANALSEPPAPAGGSFPQTTIFTGISGHPSSDVPGYPGSHFSSSSSAFSNLKGSPNGNWIINARTDYLNGTTTIIVNGIPKIFEEDPLPWTNNSGLIDVLGSNGGINDDGWWIFDVDTTELGADSYVIQVSPSDVYSIVIQEDDPVSQIPGTTWGYSFYSTKIANNDALGWSGVLTGPSPSQNQAIVFNDELIAQLGVTRPLGQVNGNNNSWDSVQLAEFFVSADSNHWSLRGQLKGSADVDEVVVVDNTVVVQEGAVLPNSSYTEIVDTFISSYMDHGGNWYTRGYNENDGQDWVYRNGVVIAERGAPIYPGSSELFSDATSSVTFGLHIGDSYGNYLVSGVTDNPNLNTNWVVVLNGETLIMREGDPLDLDNNGLFDDNAYIEFIRDDRAYLDDNGNLYFIAYVMDGGNNRLAPGLFKYDISSVLPPPPMPQDPTAYIPFISNSE